MTCVMSPPRKRLPLTTTDMEGKQKIKYSSLSVVRPGALEQILKWGASREGEKNYIMTRSHADINEPAESYTMFTVIVALEQWNCKLSHLAEVRKPKTISAKIV